MLGINERLNQRRFGLLLLKRGILAAEAAPCHIFQHSHYRKPFDTLGAPVGAEPRGMHTPHLFGVILEKHAV